MRSILCLLALPVVALSACGSPPPPAPTPVVINTPAPPMAPPIIIPAALPDNGLVMQCQGLFSQALSGQPVNYANPAVTMAGGATTVHLAAQPVSPVPVSPVRYSCTFSGTMLSAAGFT